MANRNDVDLALGALLEFLDAPLTTTVSRLEKALDGKTREDAKDVVDEAGLSRDLLAAAVLARDRLGRINDVIHAAAIAVVLPDLLEEGEVLKRPSLAAGNDPGRPFDVETNQRVAEFKLARWRGADAMRKRQVFKDLVHLAAEPSDRKRQLFVLGAEPIRFLRSSESSAGWALDRHPAVRAVFVANFGPLDTSVSAFTLNDGATVELVDLEARWPATFGLK